MWTLTSCDLFSRKKTDVASNRVFETVGVSDERSFPEPQLSQIPLTSTLSHLPDVPPVLLQLSFLVFRLVTCADQSSVQSVFDCCDGFIWAQGKRVYHLKSNAVGGSYKFPATSMWLTWEL